MRSSFRDIHRAFRHLFLLCAFLAAGLFFLSGTAPGLAQTPGAEELRRRTQEDAERQRRIQEAPDVRLPVPKQDADTLDLADEKPCFVVNSLKLEGEGADDFPWAQEYLDRYSGRCIGKEGINLIVKRLTGQFIEKGYITTRVVVPPQDLSAGTLRFTLIRGIIGKIRFSDPGVRGTWRSAFPCRAGDLLNIRDLEQGLDQMKRLPYQDVDIRLVPGERPGESEVVIAVKRGKPWRVSASLSDSGSKATGKWQYSFNVSLDNPLGLNDLLVVGLGHDTGYSGLRGTETYNFNYSVPWGYWTFGISGSTYRYNQDVEGIFQTYNYSGASDSLEMHAERVLDRGQSSKTSLQFRVRTYKGKNFIEYIEIEAQQLDSTYAELALLHRRYVGPAQIDLSIGFRQGMPWFNATGDIDGEDAPTHYYRMGTIDAGASVPFRAGIPMCYLGSLRGQFTQDRLYYIDSFSIGNRWTVRGFDGEQTLAAESGFFVRNELEAPVAQSGQRIYAGIDYGYVDGPGVANMLGRNLLGGAAGMRGAWKGFGYDISAGCPLYKPEGFQTADFTMTVQFVYQL